MKSNLFATILLGGAIALTAACNGGGGGTVTVTQPPFSVSCLPLDVADIYGDLAFDSNGDLLIANTSAGSVLNVNHADCSVTTVVTIAGENILSVVEDGPDIYAGTSSNRIYRVDPASGTYTQLSTLAADSDAMEIAPDGFGSYGGQLIVASSDGGVYAVDQSLASPAPVFIASVGTPASDLVFASDGTLYVAAYALNKIVKVAADGTVTDFVTGLSGPDGIAVDDAGLSMFIAQSGNDTLYQATISDGTLTKLGDHNFDGGYWVSGIVYDNNGTLLMHDGNAQVVAFSL